MNEKLKELLEEIAKLEVENKAKLEELAKAIVNAGDQEIQKLEGVKNDAIKTRDKVKVELKDIANKLGVDVNVENVRDAIDKIKGSKDIKETEALAIKDKEIEKLKNDLQVKAQEVESVANQYSTQLKNVIMEKDITKALIDNKAHNDMAHYIIADIKQKAHLENDKIVFKNDDGTTIRIDGKDASIDDMIKQLKEKDEYGRLFDKQVQASGTGGSGKSDGQDNVALDAPKAF